MFLYFSADYLLIYFLTCTSYTCTGIREQSSGTLQFWHRAWLQFVPSVTCLNRVQRSWHVPSYFWQNKAEIKSRCVYAHMHTCTHHSKMILTSNPFMCLSIHPVKTKHLLYSITAIQYSVIPAVMYTWSIVITLFEIFLFSYCHFKSAPLLL